jgi:transposase
MSIYIGMDLHKKTSNFCAMTKDGEILRKTKIPTIKEEVDKFIKSFGKQESLKIVLEPVSQSGFYADFLESLGAEVHLAHPKRVKAIAFAKAKTDKIDAKVLADLLRCNLLPESYHAPKEFRLLKEKARSRMSLVQIRTQLKNKVHGILFRNAIVYPKTTLFTKQGRVWLGELDLSLGYRNHLNSNLAIIDSIDKEIKTIERDFKETVIENNSLALLKTIPGIGDVTAMTILSEIGDINRFPDPRHLHSYAGLVPRVYASGESSRYGKITKEGSKFLRYVMVETAHHQLLLKRSLVGLKWYYKRLALRKNNQTAAVATARKLLTIVWKVLKEERPYQERLPKTMSILSSI